MLASVSPLSPLVPGLEALSYRAICDLKCASPLRRHQRPDRLLPVLTLGM